MSGGAAAFGSLFGVRQFAFSKPGKWTVLMTFADGTTREATVKVVGGFIMVFY